jgi:ABC-type dipeptide/oligopeptide/nickel transport system permease subunit
MLPNSQLTPLPTTQPTAKASALTTAEGGEVTVIQSGWRLGLRAFAENRLGIIGVGIVVFFVVFCWLGPVLYHGNTTTSNLLGANAPPGAGQPLGTDSQGFDILGELMVGGQTSLEIGLLASVIATVVGTLWGAIAGLAGGFLDGIMMRVVDVILAVPLLFVVLIVSQKWGTTVLLLSLIIGVFSWLVPARLVRGEVLTLRVRDFISAARIAGAKRSRLVLRHLIPNALSVVVVSITFRVADAILLVAVLGFLGFGLNYPIIDWGDMLSGGTARLLDGYWWQVYPVGICIVLAVMAFNLLGDALRDALDVRLRRR